MKLLTNFISLFLITVGLCFTGCNAPTESAQEAVVRTTHGSVSGSIEDDIFIFKGIPYAQAERFMPPQDPDAWDEILECTEYGPVARQIVSWIDESTMDEEKLFSVNVRSEEHTSELQSRENLVCRLL